MEQMGPEALMLTAAAAARTEMGDFARLEYSMADAVRVRASLLDDFEAMEPKRPMLRGLFRRSSRSPPSMAALVAQAAEGRAPEAGVLSLIPAQRRA